MAFTEQYDVVVVGAGHAGCEAARACARMGLRTAMVTMNLDLIAQMSCNPAIGGIGKGHLVREIDALGGEMAVAIDETGIQFRFLNTRKGPAFRARRAQADKAAYRTRMKRVLEATPNLTIRQASVERLIVEDGAVRAVESQIGEVFEAATVILTTGTFLKGLVHIGLRNYHAGRAGDFAAMGLSDSLAVLGFQIGRLKTGTCPRLDARTIDYSKLEMQPGDEPPPPFSFRTKRIAQPQLPCHLTFTNEATHDIIRGGLDRSPMYSGVIHSKGPRYCPSVEDKVMRFRDKERHQIFLEPEGRDTVEVYPNGLSTSLPLDVQVAMVHSIAGLERAEIMRPGYAIEYDFADPTQLRPSLETRLVSGLFFAGQINGTTGYEEAAAQGLVAGLNAALSAGGSDPVVFDRADGYLGVMIDDLVTRGVTEPYRMFTSRAEYRLTLRADNADQRLTPLGIAAGCVGSARAAAFATKSRALGEGEALLKRLALTPDRAAKAGLSINRDGRKRSAYELLSYPDIDVTRLADVWPEIGRLDPIIANQLAVDARYSVYLARQDQDIAAFRKDEAIAIPAAFAFVAIPGLSTELRQKLERQRPASLGQAARLDGMTPAALMLLLAHLKKGAQRKSA